VHCNRLPFGFLILVAVFTVAVFTAPYLVEPGTVEHLDGYAWQLDHLGRWDEMPALSRLAYYAGDVVCHQKHWRSYMLNGNQMPVCARDVGVLLGMAGGFALALTAVPAATLSGTFRSMLPFVRSRIAMLAMFGMLLAPLPVDGFLQLLTGYESVNVLRTVTGLLFGLALALLSSLFLLADPRCTDKDINGEHI
jgi:uncharacterized membrane protein